MNKDIFKLSLKIFSIIFIISSIIIYSMYHFTFKSKLNRIKVRELHEIEGHHIVAERIIDSLTSDVLHLSKSPSLRKFSDKEYIKESFLEFIISKEIHDQIRVIDIEGNEIIRINKNNGNPKIIKTKNLQNKKNRYYFEDTLKLSDGELYISPVDLNIENGKIEIPFKPIIRIGTPIFNYKKQKVGILVINYLANDLITEIKNDVRVDYSELQILNQEGYWLYSENKEEEWGFMIPEKKSFKFENKYPKDIWKEINSNVAGQVMNELGIFTYDTIYPLNVHHKSSFEIEEGFKKDKKIKRNKKEIKWLEYKWKIVSYVSKKELNNQTKEIKKDYIVPWFLFLIFSSVVAYTIAKDIVIRRKAVEERLEAEKKYRVLFEEAGESIVVTREERTIMANSRTLNLFGYAKEELLNIPVEILIYTEDREKVLINQEKQIKGNLNSMVFEARIVTKEGKVKWTEVRSTKLDFREKNALLYFFLDISERKEMEMKLKELATTDSLTGAYNRRYFTEELEKNIEKCRGAKNKLSVIMIDLDHFKNVNDTYGHDVGDMVLKKFTEISKQEIRVFDTFGRLGGEEFAIMLPNCSEEHAVHCAERIRISFQEYNFILNENKEEVSFSASLGVTEVKKDDDIENVLKRVDNALYKAKNEGRNKTVIL